MKKFVYLFEEGNKDLRELLGGKGANLSEMTNLGLNVPSGFIVTTSACNDFYKNNLTLRKDIKKEIILYVKKLEKKLGKKFGSGENPMLLTVRSGARISMPGMMDSILNLGMNDQVVEVLTKKTNNEFFAYDSYRRFIQMYGDVVYHISKNLFEDIITKTKKKYKVVTDQDLNVLAIKEIIENYKELYKKYNKKFIEDPYEQLIKAVEAVFLSWNNDRAIIYRKLNNIPDSYGTAVNVQSMVFGNMGSKSATGVVFSRNPITGKKEIYGEYLVNAQGEDVVAGVRTPKSIKDLEKFSPLCYKELVKIIKRLENHYKDMQDIEFTIEEGKLYILQTRAGKRTGEASIKIAVDLVKEKKINIKDAILRIDKNNLDGILHPVFNSTELKKATCIGKGIPSSPGAGSGIIVFSATDAKNYSKKENVILVRTETTPEDIEGMHVSKGILTKEGGRTSHAAVVARSIGCPCISGCTDLIINESSKYCIFKGKKYKEGDYISIDGGTGLVYEGMIKTEESNLNKETTLLMKWVSKYSNIPVRCNSDTDVDTNLGLKFGADGVGLCRTEHMFFSETRIKSMRKLILSSDDLDRKKALSELIKYQKEDYKNILKVLKGLEFTVRYLDPPLHEFLPKDDLDITILAKELNKTKKEILSKCESLHEFNPMMGHRGSRLLISYPDIIRMHTKALCESVYEVDKKIIPEVMIPLVDDPLELIYIKNIIDDEINLFRKKYNIKINYKFGTMIETPRACLKIKEIAKLVDFISFGTNDLTQLTFGMSRDDSSKFLNNYYDVGIFKSDPFSVIDASGVGVLMEMAIRNARLVNPKIKIGICGEQAGDIESLKYLSKLNLSYVSVSPYRVLGTKIALANYNITNKK